MRYLIWAIVAALSLMIVYLMLSLSTPDKDPGGRPAQCVFQFWC